MIKMYDLYQDFLRVKQDSRLGTDYFTALERVYEELGAHMTITTKCEENT